MKQKRHNYILCWESCGQDTPTLWFCENYVFLTLCVWFNKKCFTITGNCSIFCQCDNIKGGCVLSIWFLLKCVICLILAFLSHIFDECDWQKGRKWIAAKIGNFYHILSYLTKEWMGSGHYIFVEYKDVQENYGTISTSGGHAGFCPSLVLKLQHIFLSPMNWSKRAQSAECEKINMLIVNLNIYFSYSEDFLSLFICLSCAFRY